MLVKRPKIREILVCMLSIWLTRSQNIAMSSVSRNSSGWLFHVTRLFLDPIIIPWVLKMFKEIFP